MITFIPTPHGAGVRLWGTEEELREFYETIEHYWNCLEEATDPIELQRDNLLASFCYDIRHAYQGLRTIAKKHPVTKAEGEYFGVEITWTHVIFYFAVLRHNMRTHPSTEEDIAAINQAEESLREAMRKLSKRYAESVMPFLNGAVYCENPHLEQYMEAINHQHLWSLKHCTPKELLSFVAAYMNDAAFNTHGYGEMLKHLTKEAKRLGCTIAELTYNYEGAPYDFVW